MSVSRLKNKGDTIIEVLIAIAIVSSVLGGAFVASRQSLNITQRARDRDQGLRLVESQLERLKAAASKLAGTPSDVFTRSPGYFCLGSDLTLHNLGSTVPNDVGADTFDTNRYPAECILDNSNSAFVAGTSQSTPYYVSLQRDDRDSNLFYGRARWERAGGGRDEVRLVYRLY